MQTVWIHKCIYTEKKTLSMITFLARALAARTIEKKKKS